MGQRRKHLRTVIVTLIPLALGIIGSLSMLAMPRSLLHLRIALPSIPLGVGILLTCLFSAGIALRHFLTQAEARGRLRAEEEGQESRRRFLARLDHELKNPVTAIRAAAEVAVMEEIDSDLSENLSVIRMQAARLSSLVEGLRKVSSIETQAIESEEVDIEELIAEVVADLVTQTRSGDNEREVSVLVPRIPWRLPTIRGDMDLLYLALWNVLANAAKYSSEASTIEVRGREEEGWVILEIADSGIGIPDDEQAHIFDELVRGSQVRALPGSGIGLALVKAVIERHGGSVSVRSRHGQGSQFELRLPAPRGVMLSASHS